MIEVRGLTKRYGDVLTDAAPSFDVEARATRLLPIAVDCLELTLHSPNLCR